LRGEPVSIEVLKRLEVLVDMTDRIRARRQERRTAAIGMAIVAVSFVVVSALILIPVRTTVVDGDITASGVQFELDEPVKLAGLPLLDEIVLDQVGQVRLRDRSGPRVVREAGLLHVTKRMAGGQLTLSDLRLPAGSKIRMRTSQPGRLCRLEFEQLAGEIVPVILSANGSIGWETGNEDGQLTSERPVHFEAWPAANRISLTVAAATVGTWEPFGPVSVRSLGFLRVEDVSGAHGPSTHLVSTIQNGSLYFESLRGRAYPMRQAQMFELGVRRGYLRHVQTTPGDIRVSFHAELWKLQTGVSDSYRSLMPSWLEWWRTNEAVTMFWAGAATLVGLLMSATKWVKGVLR
jgi:hypothetical protein